jgi:replicative DNA helicase
VEAEIERAITEYAIKPDVVFVDYLGIMRSDSKGASDVDWQVQARIAEELRSLARNMQLPVVTAVQLNRDKNHGTGLDRIARSKIIGDTCDVFLQIMEKDDEEEGEETTITLPDNIMRVYFGKVREGRRDYIIELWKDFSNMRIKNKDDISVLSSELETLNTIESISVQNQDVVPLALPQDSAQDKLMRDNGDHFV